MMRDFRKWMADRLAVPLIRVWSSRAIGDAPVFLETSEGQFTPVYHTAGRRVVYEEVPGDRFDFYLICYPTPNPSNMLQRAHRVQFTRLERINKRWLCKRKRK